MIVIAGMGVFTAIDYRSSITLGSVILTVVILGLAGIITARSKIATIWREEAEGERAAKDRLQEELAAEKADRAVFDREQQELRHDLKDKIAGLNAQLKAMEAKTDLSAALEAIREMSEHGTAFSRGISEAMGRASDLSEKRDLRTQQLLEEIRDKLPNEPIAVHEIDPPSD